MESLLANYGSDDEADDCQHNVSDKEKREPQNQNRHNVPLSASLPPPRVERHRSSDVLSHGSALFASLPRPKSANEDLWRPEFHDTLWKPEFHDNLYLNDRNTAHGHKETQRSVKIGTKEDGISDLAKPGSNAETAGMAARSRAANETSSSRMSLFSALPAPKNVGSAAPPFTSHGSSGLSSKRVMEIRPTINWALLHESHDDDDDVQHHAKRLASEGGADVKPTGLAALLPKPKNHGSALGSGNASGHQAKLEMETYAASQSTASDSILSSGYVLHGQHSSLDIGDTGAAGSSVTQGRSSFTLLPHSIDEPSQASWDTYSVGPDLHNQPGPVQSYMVPSSGPVASTQEGADFEYMENYHSPSEMNSQEVLGHEITAQDALAEVLLREKRKGGRNATVNIVEVKQADLTATNLREDQLRTTGIAFGPAYKPLSTGKSKPSKLHRRKHQIGSLYYDMKQKETELIERRAKGYMTKAETQAKYGW